MKCRFNISIFVLFFFLLSGSLRAQEETVEDKKVRFGFASTTMGVINKNDAIAAVRIWVNRLIKELDIPLKPEINFYTDFKSLKKDFEAKLLDVTYLTTPELFAVSELVDKESFLVVEQSGSVAEEYILLVHKDRHFSAIQDLKDGTLNVLENARTSLAQAWFNALMAEKGIGHSEVFFKRVTILKKLNKVVLPVFFKQTDACLVTQQGINTMAELNPQISRQLKAIAISPSYVPAVFCFRKDYHSKIKELILKDIKKMALSASGNQLLTIFQMSGFRQASLEDISNSFYLLENRKILPLQENGLQNTKDRLD